jgi:chromosome segregation ATPase
MKQMHLFSAEQEATRTLQEAFDILRTDYRRLEADYGRLEARLATARVEFRKLRKERDQLKRERDNWRSSCTSLAEEYRERGMEILRLRLALERAQRLTCEDSGLFLDQVLKYLIRIAHPDKWSQQQPATELAHELVVALNDARAQLEAQR